MPEHDADELLRPGRAALIECAEAAVDRIAELEAALGECLLAALEQDAANNAVKRIVRDVMVKPLEPKGKGAK